MTIIDLAMFVDIKIVFTLSCKKKIKYQLVQHTFCLNVITRNMTILPNLDLLFQLVQINLTHSSNEMC